MIIMIAMQFFSKTLIFMDMFIFEYKSYVTNYNELHSTLLLHINDFIIYQIFNYYFKDLWQII